MWAGFDNTLILASGRVAYFGKAAEIGDHLASLGKPLPEECNPAEFVLDLVNKDFVSEQGVDRILDTWDTRAASTPRHMSNVPLMPPPRRANYFMQVVVLLQRQLLLLVKDPSLYAARCFSKHRAPHTTHARGPH